MEKEKVLTEASLSDSYIMGHSCYKLKYHNKLKASKFSGHVQAT